MARKINFEELAKNKQKVEELKKIQEEKLQIKIKEKSAFFLKTPGKIFWWFCVSVIAFCVLFITDNWLEKEQTKFEVKSSLEDKVPLMTGGWLVNSTFYWAFLDDNEEFGVHMHKIDFSPIEETGFIELVRSPIFKIPASFKTKDALGTYNTIELEKNIDFNYFIPFVLIVFCTIWLFAKPQKSFQWIMFGYFNMVAVPIVLMILLTKVFAYLNDVGLYEIDLVSLNI